MARRYGFDVLAVIEENKLDFWPGDWWKKAKRVEVLGKGIPNRMAYILVADPLAKECAKQDWAKLVEEYGEPSTWHESAKVMDRWMRYEGRDLVRAGLRHRGEMPGDAKRLFDKWIAEILGFMESVGQEGRPNKKRMAPQRVARCAATMKEWSAALKWRFTDGPGKALQKSEERRLQLTSRQICALGLGPAGLKYM
eukprot:gnl/Trimastix_PCT/296.p1 GENE.gnl/Trimastix_PCT/296~~gnl/Trimastix_PCT/296.p1  ORF type:complete len:196 (-),score=13.40 gnl/Trimastix_PCT/296:831-1418(-)